MSSSPGLVSSAAFQREALRSERVRILGILAVLAAAFLFLCGRLVLLGGAADRRLFLPFLALVGVAVLYEGLMLRAVSRAIRTEQRLPRWVWTVNVAVETLLPTLTLVILTESEVFGPYRALTAPATLTYFLFITLSTLRLSPGLARVTGVASTVGYLAVFAYTWLRYPELPDGAMPMGTGMYLTYPVFLLVGGWVAGEVARQIRDHVGVALREALSQERFRRDLEVANSIQQGLLPQAPPEVPGFDVAGWNLPCDETGGDFYHWERLPDGRTAITVADVTGHGIGPALIASLGRAYARASMADRDLGAALGRIDDLLAADLPSGKLINLIAAIVDPERNEVGLLSAGQGPLLLYRAATGSVETFKAHGVPLGVGLGPGYGPEQTLELSAGDMLLLMTDGFLEWENGAQEQFGLERIQQSICASSGASSADVIRALHEAVLEFVAGAPQQDDLTAVIVRRTG